MNRARFRRRRTGGADCTFPAQARTSTRQSSMPARQQSRTLPPAGQQSRQNYGRAECSMSPGDDSSQLVVRSSQFDQRLVLPPQAVVSTWATVGRAAHAKSTSVWAALRPIPPWPVRRSTRRPFACIARGVTYRKREVFIRPRLCPTIRNHPEQFRTIQRTYSCAKMKEGIVFENWRRCEVGAASSMKEASAQDTRLSREQRAGGSPAQLAEVVSPPTAQGSAFLVSRSPVRGGAVLLQPGREACAGLNMQSRFLFYFFLSPRCTPGEWGFLPLPPSLSPSTCWLLSLCHNTHTD